MGLLDMFRKPKVAAGMRRPNYRNTAVIERIEKEEGVDRDTAIVWFDEMLVFLDMCAASDKVLAPSKPVDAAWHAFLLHSSDYEAYCQQRFGRLIHHQPTGEPDPQAYARAVSWRNGSNYGYVDPMIWPVPTMDTGATAVDGPTFTYDSGSAGDAPTAAGGDVQPFDTGGGDTGGGGGGDSGGSSCGSSCGGGGCGGGGS